MNTPISNSSPQEQHCLDYNQESNVKFQEWGELIANKKSVMKIILDQYYEDTRAEIVLDSSHEDNMKTGELIKFFMQVQTICNDTKDKNVFFSS